MCGDVHRPLYGNNKPIVLVKIGVGNMSSWLPRFFRWTARRVCVLLVLTILLPVYSVWNARSYVRSKFVILSLEVNVDDVNATVSGISTLGSPVEMTKASDGFWRCVHPRLLRGVRVRSQNDTLHVGFRTSASAEWQPAVKNSDESTTEYSSYIAAVPRRSLLRLNREAWNYRGDFSVVWAVGLDLLVAFAVFWGVRSCYGEFLTGLQQVFYIFRTAGWAWLLPIMVLITAFFLNVRNSDVLTVSMRHSDELPITLSVGQSGFRFWHGIYQTTYNLLQLIFELPGILVGSIQASVVGCRMLAATAAASSLLAIQLLGRRRGTHWTALLWGLLVMSVPAFWINLNIARPDWPMSCLLVLAAACFLRIDMTVDAHERRRLLAAGIVCWAAAIGCKEHALMYAPLPVVYWVLQYLSGAAPVKLHRLLLFCFVAVAVCCCELLSVGSLVAATESFMSEMRGNWQGYDRREVPLLQRFAAIEDHYAPWPVLAIIAGLHVLAVLGWLRDRACSGLAAVAIWNLVVAGYSLLLVNKAWQNYYLSFFMVGVLVALQQFRLVAAGSRRETFMVSMVVVCMLVFRGSELSRAQADWWMPPATEVEQQQQLWQALRKVIDRVDRDRISICCSSLLAIGSDESFGRKQVQFKTIWAENKRFTDGDFRSLGDFDVLVMRKWPEGDAKHSAYVNVVQHLVSSGQTPEFENKVGVVFLLAN